MHTPLYIQKSVSVCACVFARDIFVVTWLGLSCAPCVSDPQSANTQTHWTRVYIFTSAGESNIRVCVYEQLHVEHVSDVWMVEHQDPFKQNHVCLVHC